MKKISIILAAVMSVLALIVGITLTTHTPASAAATTPRAYTVIVLDQTRNEEISLRHAWEAHGESGSTTPWETIPAMGDAFSLNVSGTTPAYPMLKTTSVSGMSNAHISGMNVDGAWDGGTITLTTHNGTTINIDPRSPESGLNIQEK